MTSQVNTTKHVKRSQCVSFSYYSKKLKKQHFWIYFMRSPLSKHPRYPKSTQKREIQITSLMNFSLSGQQEEKNAHSHQFLLQQLGKERNNNHLIWKERNRTVTICRWHDIIYRNSKDSTIKLRYNTFIQVADYKINIARPVAFLYTNNKISEREINNKNSVYNCIKNNKRGINLTKEVKDLLLWKLWNTKERNWRRHK